MCLYNHNLDEKNICKILNSYNINYDEYISLSNEVFNNNILKNTPPKNNNN